MNKIDKLTSEQEALILTIQDKWIEIALDTSPCDTQKAEESIKLAYEYLGLRTPQKILWFDNPAAATNWMHEDGCGGFHSNGFLWSHSVHPLYDVIEDNVNTYIKNKIYSAMELGFLDKISNIYDIIKNVLNNLNLEYISRDYLYDSYYLYSLACFDCFHQIGIDCSKLQGLWETAKYCGCWWGFTEDLAVVTPKPSIIRLDNEGRLHAEGMPAIEYKKLNIYAYHGIHLPEKYSSVHPNQWQAKWILEERNSELRQVLIQRVGYNKICQELEATELDFWHE
ncbi:MAG: hypothetical protein KME64_28880 [Scytonematopsis contorta HA4267-MV1]|jgi:hypothetical protein|nr:hypothetical protein [Scytonematopsis contorta HA4267-MV1]